MNTKQELIDEIIIKASKYGAEIHGLKNELVMLFSGYEISEKETHLAVRGVERNERILQKFLVQKRVNGLSKKTLKYYYAETSKALNEMGKAFDEVQTDDVTLYLAKKKMEGISDCTADNIRRVLSSFYNWAVMGEYVTRNPVLGVGIIRFRNKKESAFTDMEIEKIRAACTNAREKSLVELLLSTGCRAGEVSKIQIRDIEENYIIVHGKGNKDRKVFLNARAQFALKEYLSERKDRSPYLYPKIVPVCQKGGYMKNRYQNPEYVMDEAGGTDNINGIVKRVGKRSGVEGVHAHRFRRTCATHALRRGMPIEMISMMLGHEQLTTTQIYLDLNERDLELAHEKYVV